MKHCETCDRPWPEGKQHPGVFARFPHEDLPDLDDIGTLITEQGRLSDFARITFHALFCVWRYERESMNGMEFESVETLTLLGQQLCREIARYEARIDHAALRAEDKGTSAEQPATEPAKRTTKA